MSRPVVDFFFGVASRYSYLAATRIAAIEARALCAVRWRPVYSPDLAARRGADPFRGPPVSGQYDWAYRRLDAERWARLYGVPFIEPSDAMKFDRTALRRLTLACIAAGRIDDGRALIRALFAAVFAEARQLTDTESVLAVAEAAGYAPGPFRQVLEDPETAAAHAANLDEAVARGVFGVPSFLAGDALFWGNDRIDLLVHHLTGGPAPA